MEPWVSPYQRGFITGRSTKANVVELAAASLSVAAQNKEGVIVLVDFMAACPSVNHQFTMKCLDGLGLPLESSVFWLPSTTGVAALSQRTEPYGRDSR